MDEHTIEQLKELDPHDCPVCKIMEDEKAELREVARHWNEVHQGQLEILRTAVTIAQAQALGETDG